MRPFQSALVSAAGSSPWIPVDWIRESFALALQGTVSAGATITWAVQYTIDELQRKQPVSITRVTTTATGTLANHMLAVGDSVVIEGAGAPLDGTFAVASVPTVNTFTYAVTNSGATASGATATAVVLRVYTHATMTAKTAKFDGSIITPVTAVRIAVTAFTSGSVQLTGLMGHSA